MPTHGPARGIALGGSRHVTLTPTPQVQSRGEESGAQGGKMAPFYTYSLISRGLPFSLKEA